MNYTVDILSVISHVIITGVTLVKSSISFYNNIISCVFQYKMVSHVHTITNNTLQNIGPVKGFSGYNPFLTISYNHVYIHNS